MVPALLVPAFLTGLAGSGHCAVMCGGVAAAACGRPKASLTFNLGRIASYTALGAVAGGVAAMSTFFAVALRPLAAIALVGLGLHLAGITNVFTNVEKIGAPVWKHIAPLTKKPLHSTLLGALWGFVPCGLVYAALAVAASAGSALGGALAMLAFGLGTLPVMATIAALAGSVATRFLARPVVRRTAGLFVLVLGIHQTSLAFAGIDLSVTGNGAHAHAACHGH